MSARIAARLAYAAIVLLATLAGLRPDPDLGAAAGRLAGSVDPPLSARDAVDGVRNLALFAGWGVVWLLSFAGRASGRTVRNATLSAGALSAAVEGAQLLSPVRNASVLDLLTNTAGAFGGATVTLLLLRAIAARRDRPSLVGVPAFLWAAGYGGAVLLEAFTPLFRPDPVPGAWGGPERRLRLALALLRAEPWGEVSPWEGLLFVPAGALAVAALAERRMGYRAAAGWTALGGLFLAAVVQTVRGVVGQPIAPAAALVHAAGVAFGAAAGARWLPGIFRRIRGADRPRILLAAYALILAGWVWRPFRPETDLAAAAAQLASPGRWVPLRALGGRVDLFSVGDIGIQFLLFFPLGALLAVWPLRQRGPWRHLIPALALAAALELGQPWIAGRFFDVTDPLVQMAGAVVGWTMVRRAGFRLRGEVLGRRGGGG